MNSRRIEAIAPTFLSIAVFLLIGAMVCDALDGRVARMTGHSSKFGIQMDSLADIVSFGIAPGLMMVTMLRRELAQASLLPVGFDRFGQAGLLIAAIYVCCAALRLARFNVEATLEEAAHRGFRGLPSPGAASAVISLIFLHDHLDALGNWSRTAGYLTVIIPPCTLLVGLLMVSRVPYTHMVSALLSRRPFGHVVLVLLGMLLFLLYTELMAVALAWSFVISGIVRYIWRRAVGGVVPLVPEEGDHVGNENGNELERQAE